MSKINQINALLLSTPNDSFLQHALALEYIKIGEDEAAQKLFEIILQNDANYVGSYYHLGKLLERIGDSENAMLIYAKGMVIAKSLKDNHSYNELQAALEDLEE